MILPTLMIGGLWGYLSHKIFYEPTKIFKLRWAFIIRYTIGILGTFPFFLVVFAQLYDKSKATFWNLLGWLSASWGLAFLVNGLGCVLGNLLDHPGIRDD